MECPLDRAKTDEWIIAYGAKELTPEEAAAFERHLSMCARCREAAAAQRAVWSALDEWAPAPVSADFDARLFRRIAKEERVVWWQRLVRAQWSWRPGTPVAAACAVLIAAFLLSNPWHSTPSEVQSPAKPEIEQQVQRALDDIEMLKQLGVEAPPEKAAGSEEL